MISGATRRCCWSSTRGRSPASAPVNWVLLRDNIAAFANDEVQVLTISVDSSFSHKIFAQRDELNFPLLADFWPHGAVAQAYGVFNSDAGAANRGTFLVDPDGIIRFSEVNEIGVGRDPENWLRGDRPVDAGRRRLSCRVLASGAAGQSVVQRGLASLPSGLLGRGRSLGWSGRSALPRPTVPRLLPASFGGGQDERRGQRE